MTVIWMCPALRASAAPSLGQRPGNVAIPRLFVLKGLPSWVSGTLHRLSTALPFQGEVERSTYTLGVAQG